MQELYYQVQQVCIRLKKMDINTRILCACSGGQDSISLLFLLYQLKNQWNWKIGVVHANHLWRHEAVIQASKLTQISLSLGLEVYVSIPGKFLHEEQAGRVWRTRSIIRIAQLQKWDLICTAHTASDRIETLLSNLLRGTSGYSVGSISWYRVGPISLIRPMLGISRRALRDYSYFWRLPLLVDRTNKDLRIRRNRIRYELLPYLRYSYNPQVDRLLSHIAELNHLDSVYLDLLAHQLSQQYEWIGRGAVRFPWHVVKTTPQCLQLRLLYTFFSRATMFLLPRCNYEWDMNFLQSVLLDGSCDRFERDMVRICSDSNWLVVTLTV